MDRATRRVGGISCQGEPWGHPATTPLQPFWQGVSERGRGREYSSPLFLA